MALNEGGGGKFVPILPFCAAQFIFRLALLERFIKMTRCWVLVIFYSLLVLIIFKNIPRKFSEALDAASR